MRTLFALGLSVVCALVTTNQSAPTEPYSVAYASFFMGGPTLATSQIVSLEVATGARQVLTSGPGRKYAPRWTAGGIAYTRGDVNERRGVRQRVNYVSYGISFTDGRKDIPGTYSNVNWSPDATRIVFHRTLDGTWPPLTPTFSRDPQFSVLRAGVFPSYSRDGRRLMSNTAYAGQFKNAILRMNADGARTGVVAFRRSDRLRSGRLLRRRTRRRWR